MKRRQIFGSRSSMINLESAPNRGWCEKIILGNWKLTRFRMRAARAHLSRLDLCCEGTFNGDFSRAETCRAIQKSAAKQFKIPSKLALFRCPRRPFPPKRQAPGASSKFWPSICVCAPRCVRLTLTPNSVSFNSKSVRYFKRPPSPLKTNREKDCGLQHGDIVRYTIYYRQRFQNGFLLAWVTLTAL